MLQVNVSFQKENYSQRNNQLDPYGSCNVTSMVMALDYLGYSFPKGKYPQPEDNLYDFIKNVKKGEPTVHADLSLYTNEWMNRKVTGFKTTRTIEEILTELINGRPIVISGTFPGYPTKKPTPLGHIVTLVGAEWASPQSVIGRPDFMIIDDPYGNTLADWKLSGDDIKLTWVQFANWIKPCGDQNVKWGHFFLPPNRS